MMMCRIFIVLAAGLALACGAAVAQSPAAKPAVDAAKMRGEVGEQADGFLGLVTANSNPALQVAVTDINAGRAEAYRLAAAKTGVSVATAGQATARQLFARLPAGGYYRPLDGSWTRK